MSVGVDIGSKTIKAVELSKDGENYSLKAAGVVGYSGPYIEGVATDTELASLANAVKKLFSDARISGRQVAIALPESQVFTREIKFPMLTDSEIASAVKWEAEQYIPIPLTEAIVQHQILERKENATPPEVTVLLVAAPRTLVEKYTKIVSLAGLVPTFVETELMALVRSLGIEGKTVLVLDFGAKSTDIAIAKGTALVFSRSIPTAGEAFTRAVAQTLGVSATQAEEYKKAYGLSSTQLEAKIKGAIDPIFRIVTDEIKKAIHFYQSESGGEVPVSVILSGGTSGLPEAIPLLTKLLGIEVIIGNPFAKVRMEPEMAKSLAPYAPLYSIAVGLAMREEE